MKTVIATVVLGCYQEIYDITGPRMKEYAEEIGAMHVAFSDAQWQDSAAKQQPSHFAKFELFRLLNKISYDQVLYLDADVYVRKNAPNIFDTYSSGAAFNEVPHPVPENIANAIGWIRQQFDPNWPANYYFNTGVLVFTKEDLAKLVTLLAGITPQPGPFFEQGQLNSLLRAIGFPKEFLSPRWNQFCGDKWLSVQKAEAAYFLHGNGLCYSDFNKKVARLKKIIQKYP